MRSYWLSLTLVAVVLLGYTAIVLTSHAQQTTAKSDSQEMRQPAQAATAVANPNVD